jgi:amidase
MRWDEWFAHDGLGLARLVAAGELTPQEVRTQARAAVERVDKTLQGVLELFGDVANSAGDELPDRSGALYGVPTFLKDLGSGLAGRRREYGSRLLLGQVAAKTDPLVRNFLRAGLFPIGRSTTPEFGMAFDTSTDYLGTLKVTRNPWNPGRTAGGSSGGSAALVAAGVTPISMSSDGGGSTRIPASFCGLVGLKASRGRIAMPYAHNEYTWRIAVEGVVTRSIRDSAAVLDYLHVKPIGGTFYPMAEPTNSFLRAVERPPSHLRIAFSTGSWGREGQCDEQIADRIRHVALVLDNLGHVVEEVDDRTLCDWGTLWSCYLTQWICTRLMYAPMATNRGLDPRKLASLLTPMAYRHFEAAQSYSALELLQAIAGNNSVTRTFAAFFARYDILLCPACAVRVPQANGPYSLLRDETLVHWLGRFADAGRYTIPGNEVGLPGIAIPAGWDSEGMPIGAMFYAGQGEEAVLLALAAALAGEHPGWFGQLPPISVVEQPPLQDSNERELRRSILRSGV